MDAKRKSDWDMRPVYRWDDRLGIWVYISSGRYMRPCPIRIREI